MTITVKEHLRKAANELLAAARQSPDIFEEMKILNVRERVYMLMRPKD